MFYCEDCRKRNRWPEGFGLSSYGPCEMCDKNDICYDVPSMNLPYPEDVFSKEELAEKNKRANPLTDWLKS